MKMPMKPFNHPHRVRIREMMSAAHAHAFNQDVAWEDVMNDWARVCNEFAEFRKDNTREDV